MDSKMIFYAIINIFIKVNVVKMVKVENDIHNEVSDHVIVTDNSVFPYVVAILEKSRYISAGALINSNWVLTDANTMFQKRETIRTLRIRLGSINYKKGGLLLPIKTYSIHPHFDDTKPEYDIALILLARQVNKKPNLSPIRLQVFPEEITASHFIVNAWHFKDIQTKEDTHPEPFEMVQRRRMLTVSHLRPTIKEYCVKELELLDISYHNNILCLDVPTRSTACTRDVGAPVVHNGILWGIISSWKPKDCDINPGYIFVTLVSAPNIDIWIHATIHAQKWNYTNIDQDISVDTSDEYDEEDDDVDDENDV